jgi:hypothetical protein
MDAIITIPLGVMWLGASAGLTLVALLDWCRPQPGGGDSSGVGFVRSLTRWGFVCLGASGVGAGILMLYGVGGELLRGHMDVRIAAFGLILGLMAIVSGLRAMRLPFEPSALSRGR